MCSLVDSSLLVSKQYLLPNHYSNNAVGLKKETKARVKYCRMNDIENLVGVEKENSTGYDWIG